MRDGSSTSQIGEKSGYGFGYDRRGSARKRRANLAKRYANSRKRRGYGRKRHAQAVKRDSLARKALRETLSAVSAKPNALPQSRIRYGWEM